MDTGRFAGTRMSDLDRTVPFANADPSHDASFRAASSAQTFTNDQLAQQLTTTYWTHLGETERSFDLSGLSSDA